MHSTRKQVNSILTWRFSFCAFYKKAGQQHSYMAVLLLCILQESRSTAFLHGGSPSVHSTRKQVNSILTWRFCFCAFYKKAGQQHSYMAVLLLCILQESKSTAFLHEGSPSVYSTRKQVNSILTWRFSLCTFCFCTFYKKADQQHTNVAPLYLITASLIISKILLSRFFFLSGSPSGSS